MRSIKIELHVLVDDFGDEDDMTDEEICGAIENIVLDTTDIEIQLITEEPLYQGSKRLAIHGID